MNVTLFQIMAVLGTGSADAPETLARLRRILGPGGTPSLPAFYRHLRTAMAEGWVAVVGVANAEKELGRPRQVYGLTSAGRSAVRAEAERFEAFAALARGRESIGDAR